MFSSDKKSNEWNSLISRLRSSFKSVKNELSDHLEAINQNTGEIQSTNGFLAELDAKINKLSERLDELELVINPKKSVFKDIKLTPREQEVFMVLYINKNLSLTDISKRLGFTVDMVNMYVLNLICKGVPVKKELVNNEVLVFNIDSEFKDLQARRNILNIDPRIAQELSVE